MQVQRNIFHDCDVSDDKGSRSSSSLPVEVIVANDTLR